MILAGASLPESSLAGSDATQFFDFSGAVYSDPVNLVPSIATTLISLDLTGNTLHVGNAGVGSFSALAGAQFKADGLSVGDGASGTGAVLVTGAGTLATLGGGGSLSRLQVGARGAGSLSILAGATLDATANSAACSLSSLCYYSFVGAAAGATAQLLIDGADSAMRLNYLGLASSFASASYGLPGGTSQGTISISNGGSLNTRNFAVGSNTGGGVGSLGTERAIAVVTIDGVGSQWLAGRTLGAGISNSFTVGTGTRVESTVTVSNGAKLILDITGTTPGEFNVLNIGANGARGTLEVNSGGELRFVGDETYIAVGLGFNATGSFSVLSGAKASAGSLFVGGDGYSGSGSTGSATIAGAGSVLRLTGSSDHRLSVGRLGTGSVSVLDGGVLDASTSSAACNVSFNLCGSNIAVNAGSTGTLTVSGVGSEARLGDFIVAALYDYSSPGVSSGTVNVLKGATLRTNNVILGNGASDGHPSPSNERAVAFATIDGPGSQWIASPDPVSANGFYFKIGEDFHALSTMTVSSGGKLVIDGLGAPADISIGDSGARGALIVTTGGSVEVRGPASSISVGDDTGSVGSFSLLSGGQASAASIYVGQGPGSNGTLNVSGPGSALWLDGSGSNPVLVSIGLQGGGTVQVDSGGLIDAKTRLTACIPSPFGAPFSSCYSGVGSLAGSTGTLIVSGAGSVVRLATLGVGGTFVVNDGSGYGGLPGATGSGFVKVLAGSRLETMDATLGLDVRGPGSIGTEHAEGTALVDGIGSVWRLGYNPLTHSPGNLTVGTGSSGHGVLTVQKGGQVVVAGIGGGTASYLNIAVNGGSGSVTVAGAGSSVLVAGDNATINIGLGGQGNQGSFSVLAGASATTLFSGIGRSGAIGNLVIDGAGSVLSQLGAGVVVAHTINVGGAAFALIGQDGGKGTVSVTNGGRWLIGDGGQDSNASPGIDLGYGSANASGSLVISGTGSTVEVRSTSLVSDASEPDNFNPYVAVGRSPGNTGQLLVSAGGLLLLSGNAMSTQAAPRVTALNVGAFSATTTTHGAATVTGQGSRIVLAGNSDRIYVGQGTNSAGALDVLDHGSVQTTSFIAGDRGAMGAVSVDNGLIELKGYRADLTNTGASMTIGRGTGGNATMRLSNGAQVTIQNDRFAGGLNIGGDGSFSGGTGSVSLIGGSTIQLLGTVPGSLTVGRTGVGIMTLSGASQVNVGAGAVYVARFGGSTGTLSIAGNSMLGAAYVGIGSTPGVDGGSATLTLDNSTLIANTLEIGRNGEVNGDGGLIIGNVINRGVFHPDPPGVPGTLVIDGRYTNHGGALVLDILSDHHGGFITSHLVFKAGSSFDFTGLKVTFEFLAGTDPNAFLRTGAFGLDTFLNVRSPGGQDSGLSSTFGLGQSYASALGSAVFTAASSDYAINNFSFEPGGAVSFSAVPVPEPGTWGLLLTGIFALSFRLSSGWRRPLTRPNTPP